MIRTTDMMQRTAAMPTAAPVGPAMLRPAARQRLGRWHCESVGAVPHPRLHGQAFRPAPREILDIDACRERT